MKSAPALIIPRASTPVAPIRFPVRKARPAAPPKFDMALYQAKLAQHRAHLAEMIQATEQARGVGVDVTELESNVAQQAAPMAVFEREIQTIEKQNH